MNVNKEFGERLKTFRKERGFTQLEVARRLEITPQAVSKWESGGCLPDCLNLQSLSELYGVSADTLLQIRHSGTADDLGRQIGLMVQEFRRTHPDDCLFSLVHTLWKHICTAAAGENPYPSLQLSMPEGTVLYDDRGFSCLLQNSFVTEKTGQREWELLHTMTAPACFRLLTLLHTGKPVTKTKLLSETELDSESFHSLLLLLLENRIIEYVRTPDGENGYRLHPRSGFAACLLLTAGTLLSSPAGNIQDLP